MNSDRQRNRRDLEHAVTEANDNLFPAAGRIAAIDYGTVRIGVAVCDPDRILASPLEVYAVRGREHDADYFRALVKMERLVGFIVGLPIHCDGGESQKSRECREFAVWLNEQTNLPIRLFDERFSTLDAKQRLSTQKQSRAKRKKQLDAVAALVLLESFLEASRYNNAPAGQPLHQPPQGGAPLS